ncbi:ACT domain-containing protein [Streptomyces cavernicola]|uniref:ACT domain-containing protein n=1 Tax=Streptomyces cavernicola TaxID=3043613 RepID=A0ABT6SA57_9ACTN|nr:hypothetical protein [Streptomyces sp. B-S-A6]MDI3405073.1 hypothetical protein [Streptomyces sp. B-S-A6]
MVHETLPAYDSDADPDCTLTVTLHNEPSALRRVLASLGTIPVTELSYAAPTHTHATARITVPRTNATRARNKLNRMVDVLAVVPLEPR